MGEVNEKQGMTISAALKERKLIDSKIVSAVEEVGRLSAHLSTCDPAYKDQKEKVESLIQRVKDLELRKFELTVALERANLDTVVEFKGKQYSLRQILFLKGVRGRNELSGHRIRALLLQSLQTDKQLQSEADQHNRRKAENEKPIAVVRYFDPTWRDRQKGELDELMLNLDTLIERANLMTFIPDLKPMLIEEEEKGSKGGPSIN